MCAGVAGDLQWLQGFSRGRKRTCPNSSRKTSGHCGLEVRSPGHMYQVRSKGVQMLGQDQARVGCCCRRAGWLQKRRGQGHRGSGAGMFGAAEKRGGAVAVTLSVTASYGFAFCFCSPV